MFLLGYACLPVVCFVSPESQLLGGVTPTLPEYACVLRAQGVCACAPSLPYYFSWCTVTAAAHIAPPQSPTRELAEGSARQVLLCCVDFAVCMYSSCVINSRGIGAVCCCGCAFFPGGAVCGLRNECLLLVTMGQLNKLMEIHNEFSSETTSVLSMPPDCAHTTVQRQAECKMLHALAYWRHYLAQAMHKDAAVQTQTHNQTLHDSPKHKGPVHYGSSACAAVLCRDA